MEDQIRKAVDCYEAGARVLHVHVRELDGKGSKHLSKFNELLAGIRIDARCESFFGRSHEALVADLRCDVPAIAEFFRDAG